MGGQISFIHGACGFYDPSPQPPTPQSVKTTPWRSLLRLVCCLAVDGVALMMLGCWAWQAVSPDSGSTNVPGREGLTFKLLSGFGFRHGWGTTNWVVGDGLHGIIAALVTTPGPWLWTRQCLNEFIELVLEKTTRYVVVCKLVILKILIGFVWIVVKLNAGNSVYV